MVLDKPAPLVSTFRLSYYSILNLMSRAEGQFTAEHVIKNSFHQFQYEKALPDIGQRISKLEREAALLDSSGEPTVEQLIVRKYNQLNAQEKKLIGEKKHDQPTIESRNWARCSRTLGWIHIEEQNLGMIMDRLADGFRDSVEHLVACILISEAVFYIWEERNRRIYNEGELGWMQIWRKIKAQAAKQMYAKVKSGRECQEGNPKLVKLAQLGLRLQFFEPL